MKDMMKEKKKMILFTKDNQKLLRSGLGMLVVLIIAGAATWGWFANSDSVGAEGASVQMADGSQLIVRKESGGENIAVIRSENPGNPYLDDLIASGSTIDGEALLVQDNIGDTPISPGSHGSFPAYVVVDPERVGNYGLHIRCLVSNDLNYDEYAEDDESVKTVDGGVYVSEESTYDTEQALKYMNSHLAFFTEYDEETGKYSGWIAPGEDADPLTIAVDEQGDADYEQEVTIYWIWFRYYGDVQRHVAGDANEQGTDLNRIEAYIEEHPEEWFYTGDVVDNNYQVSDVIKSLYYNNADVYIAMTIKRLCFLVDFSIS